MVLPQGGDDTIAPSRLLPLGPKPTLLDGESLTNVVKPVAFTLSRKRGGGGEFDGALHITNFRLILQRTGASQVCFVGVGVDVCVGLVLFVG